uniref:DUF3810 domain-containing protein n=1 Tax=Prevotella sp. TaxID=59823 RepID=UPI0040254FCD
MNILIIKPRMKLSNTFNRLRWRHWLLLSLLVLVLVIKWSPYLGYIYTLYIYSTIGRILSSFSGIFPFAIGDIFIALSIAWVILYPLYEIVLRKRLARRYTFLAAKGNSYPKTKTVWGRVAEYLLWIYVWFYMAWGLNYSQPNIYQRIGMKTAEVDKDKLREFAYRYADSLNSLSEELSMMKVNGLATESCRKQMETAILREYDKIGRKEGINPSFNPHPHVKTMVFTPLSSMVGVTGSMAPFFCEFTLNGDIRPHDYPAIYAHEYAHFLGIANEGEANFYSYLACTSSTDKAVKFSGYYHILPHVLNSVFNLLGEKEGEKFLNHIRPEIIRLAKDDRNYWLSKRSKALSSIQDYVFDLYLKGNHVSEGRKSYSGVVALIMAWEELQQREK